MSILLFDAFDVVADNIQPPPSPPSVESYAPQPAQFSGGRIASVFTDDVRREAWFGKLPDDEKSLVRSEPLSLLDIGLDAGSEAAKILAFLSLSIDRGPDGKLVVKSRDGSFVSLDDWLSGATARSNSASSHEKRLARLLSERRGAKSGVKPAAKAAQKTKAATVTKIVVDDRPVTEKYRTVQYVMAPVSSTVVDTRVTLSEGIAAGVLIVAVAAGVVHVIEETIRELQRE